MANYEHVMRPIRVGRHLIKNRIIAAPVTLHSASNGEPYPAETAMQFFEQRAKAGAGTVVCAGVKLLPVQDDGEHASWDMYRHNAMNRLAELAERIHFYGAKASMELIGIFEEGYVASDGGLLMDGMTPGREIPVSEMMRYKEAYGHCAEKLLELGFDGLLLHFGHSIPIAQFLSPLTNKRTDQYGGNFENRVRYLVEILQEIRGRVGDEMFIEIRMSANEFKAGGIDTEEGIRIAEVLGKYADIIQASCGMVTPELMCRTHPCDFLPPNPNVHLADAFRSSGRLDNYITAIGAIGSLADADEIIASGKADFVAMSRSLIADPELMPKSLAGEEDKVVPCIKCMRCHDSAVFGHFFQCSVNPVIGLGSKLEGMIRPAERQKKVAVIGGGPGGMSAALTASKRGHHVTLFEKSSALGGTLNFADKVDFKYSLARFKNFLIQQTNDSAVEVRLETEATPDLLQGAFDAVVASVGAEPVVPAIAGIKETILATDVYGKEKALGEKILVIGGGQVGCETALHLARMGKKVTIMEMKDELAPDASPTHRGDILAQMDKEGNLKSVTGAKCIRVESDSAVYQKKGSAEESRLPADTVILAVGMKARREEADCFIGVAQNFWAAGDCQKARTAETAVREGYFAGINI